MISVLICSANESLLNQVILSIQKTIGLGHEVIYHDNTREKLGICAAYNRLAEKAKYPYLCFIHEDIIFNTANWGEKLLRLFDETVKADLIGVAGGKYKSRCLSGWYTGLRSFDCVNISHQYPDRKEKIYLKPPGNVDQYENDVACIDGVFMAVRKSVWNLVKFNEQDLKGFHFYDIDFSLRTAFQYRVVVTYEIDIVHLTAAGGDYGDEWIKTAFWFHEIYGHNLPFTKLYRNSQSKDEFLIKKIWLEVLKSRKISLRLKLRWVRQQKLYKDPRLYLTIIKFMLYHPLGLKKIHRYFKS